MPNQTVLAGLAAAILALPASAADAPDPRAVARQVLEETKATLEGALAGGQPAVSALRVCAAVAQDLARKHEKEGWRVRRVSEKFRNPADAPDAVEREVLRRWAQAQAEGRLSPKDEYQESVTEDGARYVRYMRPIFIAGPVCLQCHGAPAALAPGLADALRDLYPDDRATGYKVGDLRGAISVRAPMTPQQ